MNNVLELVIAIAIVILNIVGIVWLGIKLGHFILVPVGYIIILVIVGSLNETACLILGIIVASVTFISVICSVVALIVEAVGEKKQQKEQIQKNNQLLDAVNRKDCQTAQKVIENGANVNFIGYINSKNRSMLQIAVENGDKDMVLLLIEKGTDINLVNDGKTPLDFAEDDEIITILKEQGAKTKSELEKAKIEQDRLNSDFVSAVRCLDRERVKDLLPKITNINGIIPDELVTEVSILGHGSVTENLTPFLYAVLGNDIEIVKLLAENGADINASDSHNRNAVIYAVFSQNIEMIDFLASKGIDVNAKSFNEADSSVTALMVATFHGNIEIVEALIRNGADVNAKTGNGATALFAARHKGYRDIEILLKKSGAWR